MHFAETVVAGAGGPGMTFDYRARPGLATSTNALRVLELVGLPTGDDGVPDGAVRHAVRAPTGGNPSGQ